MPKEALATADVLRRLNQAEPFVLENRPTLDAEHNPLADCFVQSTAMREVREQLRLLAGLPIDTVLLGPTGAGKDTLAQWLHQQSGRSGSFVHLNCAALPESLFEAEMFGVKAGAFTGATESRAGRLQQADGGTLYLDEIDSLPLPSQAKLLIAIQYRGATPLGGDQFFASDFRLIVSSKTDFKTLVERGCFREDLYYRLNLSQVRIPALSERSEDIVPLYSRFLLEAAQSMKRPVPELSLDEECELLSTPWPGNVRELRAHAFRRVIGLKSDCLGFSQARSFDLKQLLQQYERALLQRVLVHHGGKVKDSAKQLGLTPQALYYRMKALGVGKRDL